MVRPSFRSVDGGATPGRGAGYDARGGPGVAAPTRRAWQRPVGGAVRALPMRGGPGSPAEILASVPFAERTLPGLLESRRSTALGQVAVEIEGRPVTWAEIDSHSAMLAAGLASLGVSAGDVVCKMAANTVGHVMTIFAVARL